MQDVPFKLTAWFGTHSEQVVGEVLAQLKQFEIKEEHVSQYVAVGSKKYPALQDRQAEAEHWVQFVGQGEQVYAAVSKKKLV